MTGAALTTVLGQIVAFLAVLLNHFKPRDQLSLRRFRPNGRDYQENLRRGLPSIILNSISSLMIFGMNKILLGFYHSRRGPTV